MKVYNEVTIDMNPESSTYREHTSEDSYQYKGNIDLCCGKSPKWKLPGKEGQPAWQAMGFKDKPFGQSQEFEYPTQLPSVYDQAMPVGGEYIGGTNIEGATLGPFDVRAAHPAKSFFYDAMGGVAERHDERIMKEYGERFGPQWYEPLIKSAIEDPIRSTLQREMTTPEARFGGILPEDILTGAKSHMGGTSWASPDQYLVAGGQTGTPQDLTDDLDWAETLYTQSAEDIADQRGDIDYDRILLGQERIREEDKYEEDLQEAQKMRLKEQGRLGRQVSGVAEGQLDQFRKYTAPIGKSGFAYSGPAQQYAETGAKEQKRKFRDLAIEKREAENKYQKALKDREEDYDETVRDLDKEERVFDRQDEALDRSLREARNIYKEGKVDYAKGIQDLAKSAGDDLTGLQNWITGMRPRHAQFGKMLGEQTRGLGVKELQALGGKRRLRNMHKADIFGKTTYDAPAGGWFRESGPIGGYQGPEAGGVRDISKADAFADYLAGLGYGDIAESAFGEDWKTDVPFVEGAEGTED